MTRPYLLRNVATLCCLLFLAVAQPSADAQIVFEDATDSALEGFSSETWGASVGDYNGDFWPDIFVGNHRQRPSLYRNNGDGTFTNVILQVDPGSAWLSNQYMDHHGAGFTDLDGDGDDDLLSSTNGCCPAQLMISNGKTFEDQGVAWGVAADGAGWSVTWLDHSGDGFNDLARMSFNTSDLKTKGTGNDQTYFQPGQPISCTQDNYAQLGDLDGDLTLEFMCAREGTFPQRTYRFDGGAPTEVSHLAPTIANTLDTVIADFDNDLQNEVFAVRGIILPNQAMAVSPTRVEASVDADPVQGRGGVSFKANGVVDLVVYSRYSSIKVYRGDSGSRTTETPGQLFTLDPSDSRYLGVEPNMQANRVYVSYDPATTTWTITQDGSVNWWYLYIVAEAAGGVSDVALVNERPVDLPFRPQMAKRSAGSWSNVTWESGFREDVLCSAAAAGDFDNDMDQDLYLVCRNGVENIANRMFENQGNGFFVEVAAGGGAEGALGAGLDSGAGTGESVVTADYDNDGFLDLFVTNGLNTQPLHVGGPHQIFRNQGNANHWLELELRSAVSNHHAVGATVIATAGGVSQLREQNGGHHRWSQNHQRIHFGLGSHTTVDLQIRWPSGVTETFSAVAANKLYNVVEGQGMSVVTPGQVADFDPPQPTDECGEPTFVSVLDAGLFIHKDCSGDDWQLRIAAGGDSIRYAGRIKMLTGSYSNVNAISHEGGDVLDTTSNDEIVFDLSVAGRGTDGIDFRLNGEACLVLNTNGAQDIYLGAAHVKAGGSVNLTTLQPCAGIAPPTLSVEAASVDESVGAVAIEVRLSSPADDPVTVKFATRALSAIAGEDFYGTFQVISFAPGETSKSVFVSVIDDFVHEDDESFTARLFAPNGADISTAEATISIADNDAVGGAPTLSVSTVSVNESVGSAEIAVELSPAATETVRVRVATRAGSATAGSDFYGAFQILEFAPGEQTKSFAFTVVDDNAVETDETVILRLFQPEAALVAEAETPITIIDDDVAGGAEIVIADVTVYEGDGIAAVTISLSVQATDPVSVKFATQGQSASAGVDFFGTFQVLDFAPGETSKTVELTIIDDGQVESDETFTARLFGVVGATITDGQGVITIIDND